MLIPQLYVGSTSLHSSSSPKAVRDMIRQDGQRTTEPSTVQIERYQWHCSSRLAL